MAATYYGLWPDIVYLGSDEPSKNRWLPGDGMFKHGSIVGYMIGDVDVQVIYDFQLVLGDPFPPELRSNHEIVTAARKWHQATDTDAAGDQRLATRVGDRLSGCAVTARTY